MGDRTNFHFKVNEDTLTLYSHWGGTWRKQDLARALSVAMPRIQMGDIDYALRVCISQLIGADWNQETGFGLRINNPQGAEEEYGYLRNQTLIMAQSRMMTLSSQCKNSFLTT
jgi:hypothetical protein